MNKNPTANLKIPLIWVVASLAYIIFIGFLCFLLPLGGDEYSYYPTKAADIIQGYILTYFTNSPRIGAIPARIVLYLGKDAFTIINPIIQLTIVFLSFYAVFLKLPNFKTLKDLPAFLLIMTLSFIAAAQPDNNLFWLGGANNNNWPFLLFLPLVIIIRLTLNDKEPKILNFKYSNYFCFTLAFIMGMSGETISPSALMFAVFAAIYMKFLKIKIPHWLKIIIAGIITGLAIFFTAPGLYFRLSMQQYNTFNHIPLYIKILNHLPIMAKACAANLFLFPLTIIILLITAIKNKTLKNKAFIFPLIMLFLALSSASALAMAPIKNLRPFYPASIFSILAFISAINLSKLPFRFFFYAFFVYAALIIPLFIPPFVSLHRQELFRQEILNNAIIKGRQEVYLSPFITIKGPYDNLTIYFYDEPASIRSKYKIITQPAGRFSYGQTHIKQY